jgi:CRISPR type I-E-associated protein CasB/Cse2
MTPLVESLQKLKDDRGAMASLRKALIPEQRQRCFRYLPRLGCKFESEHEVLRISILAYFWGNYPSHSDVAGNLGQSMRRITNGSDEHPFRRRFERIIATDSLSELADQLQGAVSLLKKTGSGIEFNQLNNDLYWFSRNPNRVKLEWSGGFYLEVES